MILLGAAKIQEFLREQKERITARECVLFLLWNEVFL